MSKSKPERPSGSKGSTTCAPAEGAHLRLMAVTAMASALAHDLIQPLTAALNYLHGSARQLKTCAETAESAAMIELAASQTIKAVEIIQRVRSFALEGEIGGRPESLRVMIDRVRGDLILQNRLDAELVVRVDPGANFVMVDRIAVELVITNLMANALEAVAGSKVRKVELQSRRLGDEVELTIADSGPGFSESARQHLFDPCFTTKPQGSGLGLPICKAIVEAHGGRLWTGTSDTAGAIVHVTLPAVPRRLPENRN